MKGFTCLTQVKEKVYAPIFTKKAVFSDYNTIILPKLFHYEETLYYYFCGFLKKIIDTEPFISFLFPCDYDF